MMVTTGSVVGILQAMEVGMKVDIDFWVGLALLILGGIIGTLGIYTWHSSGWVFFGGILFLIGVLIFAYRSKRQNF
jgi:predicted membrane channel-forming protein YqfA (hemolysin III family)